MPVEDCGGLAETREVSKPWLGDGWLLLVFMLAMLLLLTRGEFWQPDGEIEYRVAQRLVTHGSLDLPDYQRIRDYRVRRNSEGRFYSQFGLGQSLLFVPTILADRAVIRYFDLEAHPGIDRSQPFFFSISANALVLALTGLCLCTLLLDLRMPRGLSLFVALLYVLGTMALIYSQLSFDMPLSVLSMLAMFLFLFRATDSGKTKHWLLSGLCFGFAVITRANNLVFFLPVSLHVALSAATDRPRRRAWLAGGLAFSAAWLPALLVLLCYNHVRYGSLVAFGYNRPGFPVKFATPWMESIPALLFSPGRSMFVFALPLLFAIPGLVRFARHDRRKALVLLLTVTINLLLFARWTAWRTPYAWGPRFQLLVVALMFVPLAFWLQAHWGRLTGRFKWVPWFGLTLCVAVQLPAAIAGFGPLGDDGLWRWDRAQVVIAAAHFWDVLKRGDAGSIDLWWATAAGRSPPMTAVLMVIVAALVASLAGLWRAGRKEAGCSQSRVPPLGA